MLIGLTGKKQAGKDTAYQRLAELYRGVFEVERASFADLLYRSASEALGVTVDDLYAWKVDPAVRIQIVRLGVSGEDDADTNDIEFLRELDIREYLQRYGTEAHREVFGDNFWVDQLTLEHDGKIVAVTDTRFPNEAAAIRRAGGFVVRVVGPPEVEEAGDGHASEVPLPVNLVDYVVKNDHRDGSFMALDLQLTSIVNGNL